MSEPDAYEDEMRRLGRLSDEDIACLLRGELPESAWELEELEELAAFARAARASLVVPPPVDVGVRQLAAIAAAARARPVTSRRPLGPRMRPRALRVAGRLALVAVGGLLGMAGLASAGVDLPQPADEVLQRTGIGTREESPPERQPAARDSQRAPRPAPAIEPPPISPGAGPAGDRTRPAGDRPEHPRPSRADRRDDMSGGAPAQAGRSSDERAAERGPQNGRRGREAADPAREGAAPPTSLPPQATEPGAAVSPDTAGPPEGAGPPQGAGPPPSMPRPTTGGPPK